MPLPPAEPLFDQLAALREADDPTDPRHAPRWRAVARWLEQAFSGTTPEAEDARQETLLSLFRNVHRMQADAPLKAAKWVATIHRHKRMDGFRARATDPVRKGLASEPARPGATPLLDRLAAEDAPTLNPAILESLVTTVLHHVHRELEKSVSNPATRQLRRTQAQAALLRLVCGWEAKAILLALDHGEPVTKDRLYKWIERGREPVRAGLARWEQSVDDDERETHVGPVVSVLREIMDDRRADAGKPRPTRRKLSEEPR